MDKALEKGELFDHDGWKYLEPAAKEQTLHLIGLLSDGGVHSRYNQLWLLIQGVRSSACLLHKKRSLRLILWWFQSLFSAHHA